MSDKERRIEKAEEVIGASGQAPGFVFVSWQDDGLHDADILRLNNGLQMTWAEYKKRYGSIDPVVVTWDDYNDD